jgi:hypothetical protein
VDGGAETVDARGAPEDSDAEPDDTGDAERDAA